MHLSGKDATIGVMKASQKNQASQQGGASISMLKGVGIGLAVLTVLFLLLPLIWLCLWPTSDELIKATLSPMLWDALKISLITSSVSTCLVIIFGGVLAYMLARYEFPGKMVVDTLIDLPMVLPPMVTGLALLLLLGRNGPFGNWLAENGLVLTFTLAAVIIAQVFVALPFFIRAARAGFESVDQRLETASLMLGASKIRTFLKITVPLVWPTLLAGTILAWARCLGEFGATVVFAGNFQGVTQTMPLAIFGALQDDIGVAVALSIILLLVSFTLVLLLKFVIGSADAAKS